MHRFAHKMFWFFIFILIMIGVGRLDFYYGISDEYRNSPFIFTLADWLGVFPDGEEIGNFKEWIIIHAIILFTLLPFSVIRLLAPAVVQANTSILDNIKKIPIYYLKITLITIGFMLVINVGFRIIG
jgi:hypothetical protein